MELKPCSRCNSASEIFSNYFDGEEIFGATCTSSGHCLTLDDIYKTEAEAIAAWNTRPIEDALNQRIKELEEQVFALSTGTRSSRDAERIKELEQWQKEAVEFLPLAKDDMEDAIRHDPLNRDEYKKELEQLTNLIKQAEGK
jgi:ferredoxin